MNSFSGVRKALEYEIPRQIEVLESGGKLIQSTRRWDDVGGHHRGNAHQGTRARLPLFPRAGLDAVRADGGLAGGGVEAAWWSCRWRASSGSCAITSCPPSDAQTFVWDVPLGNYFEAVGTDRRRIPKAIANWVINNLRAKLAEARNRRSTGLKFKPDGILPN